MLFLRGKFFKGESTFFMLLAASGDLSWSCEYLVKQNEGSWSHYIKDKLLSVMKQILPASCLLMRLEAIRASLLYEANLLMRLEAIQR